MSTTMTREIRNLVRKSVQEAVESEVKRIRASLVPLVSKSEMANITKLYKKPSGRRVRTIQSRF